MSREKILNRIPRHNVAEVFEDPDFFPTVDASTDLVAKFCEVLISIGGAVIRIPSVAALNDFFREKYHGERIISLVEGTHHFAPTMNDEPHSLENVALTVMQGEFGVAENGAVWITDKNMGDRALPFIASHLALVVSVNNIVPNLHEAYKRIGDAAHSFGTFIAGPSKTADIEQSLVLGAHGPKSNTIFLLG